LEAVKIFSLKNFEISILLEFELNHLEMLDKIKDKFNALTVYLDSISK